MHICVYITYTKYINKQQTEVQRFPPHFSASLSWCWTIAPLCLLCTLILFLSHIHLRTHLAFDVQLRMTGFSESLSYVQGAKLLAVCFLLL